MAKRKRNGYSAAQAFRSGRRPAKRGKMVLRKMRRYSPNARVGGFLGLELKFLDTAWNGVAVSASTDGASGELQPSSGCTGCISCPGQGDGESQRDGRKFVIKSVYFSGVVATTHLQTETVVQDLSGYYFALVLDTQANGATIASENIYLNPGTSSLNLLPQPLRNLQNSGRFRILASKYVPVRGAYTGNDAAGTFSVSNQATSAVSLSWKGSINVDTIGTSADVASVSDNAIHIVAYAGDSTMTPVFQGKCRMRFMG